MATTSDQLARFVAKMDSETITKEDFTKAFEQVLALVRQIMERNERALESLEQTYRGVSEKMSGDSQTAVNDLKGQVNDVFVGEKISGFEKRINDALNKMETHLKNRMSTVKSGKDADTTEVALKTLGLMPTPFDPRELKGEVNVAKKDIDALWKEIEELKGEKKLGGVVGGGTSTIGVKYAMGRLVTSETPTGDIDGVNKAYTLTQPPQAILSFYINGQYIHPAEYTLAGGTITFITALPAALSGTGFTVTYI